jgi:hypothetical protein
LQGRILNFSCTVTPTIHIVAPTLNAVSAKTSPPPPPPLTADQGNRASPLSVLQREIWRVGYGEERRLGSGGGEIQLYFSHYATYLVAAIVGLSSDWRPVSTTEKKPHGNKQTFNQFQSTIRKMSTHKSNVRVHHQAYSLVKFR